MSLALKASQRFALSAFGLAWPAHIPMIARRLERYGYNRLWLPEHHLAYHSASPLVAAAAAAAATRRLAVGTAGIMLRYVSPIRVAKDAHLLEVLFPNRVDIGIISGSAGPVNSALHNALSRGVSADVFKPEDYQELVHHVRNPDLPLVDGTSAAICRADGRAPRLWLCSHNPSSAALAGRLGVGFIVHLPQALSKGLELVRDPIAAYRDSFTGNAWLQAPFVSAICGGVCANTTAEAERTFRRYVDWSYTVGSHPGRSKELPRPLATFFLGDPPTCRSHITEIATDLGLDEVIVYSAADSVTTCLRGHALIAQAFGLTALPSALENQHSPIGAVSVQ